MFPCFGCCLPSYYPVRQHGGWLDLTWIPVSHILLKECRYRQWGFVASLPLIYWNVNDESIRTLLLNKWFLYGLILALSWLMVSTLPLMALKFKDFSVKNNLPKYLLVVSAIAALLLLKWLAVPVIVLAYVLISLLFKNKTA